MLVLVVVVHKNIDYLFYAVWFILLPVFHIIVFFQVVPCLNRISENVDSVNEQETQRLRHNLTLLSNLTKWTEARIIKDAAIQKRLKSALVLLLLKLFI